MIYVIVDWFFNACLRSHAEEVMTSPDAKKMESHVFIPAIRALLQHPKVREEGFSSSVDLLQPYRDSDAVGQQEHAMNVYLAEQKKLQKEEEEKQQANPAAFI